MTIKESKANIKNIILELGNKRNLDEVFTDVVTCIAYSFANVVDFKQEREDKYLEIVKKYSKEELNLFSEVLKNLVEGYENLDYGEDILGSVYTELKLIDKRKGQFFTPIHIANFMARLTFDKDTVKEEVKEKGFISICDDACGSGRILYSAYQTLLDYGVKQNEIFFEGTDIDLRCCCMTYIQLNLTGASAIVNHKNALTNETYDTFYTLCYKLNNKLQYDMQKRAEKNLNDEEIMM